MAHYTVRLDHYCILYIMYIGFAGRCVYMYILYTLDLLVSKYILHITLVYLVSIYILYITLDLLASIYIL